MTIILIILAILYIIAKDECDQIVHHQNGFFPNWKWYSENNWRTKSWWLKYPFSMFCDGWHFMDSLRNSLFGFALSIIYFGEITWWNLLFTVIYYASLGVYHNMRSGSFLGLGLDQDLNV
jgi:hypothetical protein